MRKKSKQKILSPAAWGLEVNGQGELIVGDCSTVSLAKKYGTPLHIVDESRLEGTAREFRKAFETSYQGKVSVHYAFKCNSVPGIIEIMQRSGLKAEVMSEFELMLALNLGFGGNDLIINGPCKPISLLQKCLEAGVRFIVVDSLEELKVINEICQSMETEADILLRINPDYIPKGMNQGTATGSRKGCAFGLDLKGDEVDQALLWLKTTDRIHFRGFHFHIGTGIRNPDDYCHALHRLKPLIETTEALDFKVEVFDAGGGFAARNTREMTTREMLVYQGWEKLPVATKPEENFTFDDFAQAIATGIRCLFPKEKLPELLLEPGRSITSSNQMLLLTVHRVKERPGVKKWLIADGGLGTVSMPTYYEYHELFLCDDATRPRTENVTIIGSVCFAGDVVYKNKLMPIVHPGEVLAIMDSGAYFTAMESSFGFPRPAIVAASNGQHRLLRRREVYRDMIARDYFVEYCSENLNKKNINFNETVSSMPEIHY
jgi:diaminopimelate decarboxylase